MCFREYFAAGAGVKVCSLSVVKIIGLKRIRQARCKILSS